MSVRLPIPSRKIHWWGDYEDRYMTLRRFAPELIAALEFKAARPNDPMLSTLKLLHDLDESGRRRVSDDAPMPFRNEWKQRLNHGGWATKSAVVHKPLCLRRCVTGCAREMCGSIARRTTAGSTAICCPRMRCRRLPPSDWSTRNSGRMARTPRGRARCPIETLFQKATARPARGRRAPRRPVACNPGEGSHSHGGRSARKADRRLAAASQDHRDFARGGAINRFRLGFHKPSHWGALRKRERAARCDPCGCHQSWSEPHGSRQPWCDPRSARVGRPGAISDLRHTKQRSRRSSARIICYQSPISGRWHHVVVRRAVLPVR